MLFLLKIYVNKESSEFKLMKMLFFDYVREILIFEIGFFHHTHTHKIEEKIPILRSIVNSPSLIRKKLINIIEMVL